MSADPLFDVSGQGSGQAFGQTFPSADRLTRITVLIALMMITIPWAAIAQGTAETEDEKAFYAIGTGLSNQLMDFTPISDREFELILQGMRDAIAGTSPTADPQANRQRVRKLAQARQESSLERETEASAAFLAAAARKSGAIQTESGLIIREIKAGTGKSPKATDKVRVHYHGTLRDGTVFDSSVDRGKPATFPLNRVIPCWTEGVAMMKEGGKSELICPADIAYGKQRKGRIPPGAALVFEVELLKILN